MSTSIKKKICIIGGFAAGKTSLVRRYVLQQFSSEYHATLGVNIYKYSDSVEVPDRGTITIDQVIWDVEGSTTRRETLEAYVRGSAGALIVGDVTRAGSVAEMVTHAELFERVAPGRPMVFAFNKIDLSSVSFAEERTTLSGRFGGTSLYTSAATGEAVPALFSALARRIVVIGA